MLQQRQGAREIKRAEMRVTESKQMLQGNPATQNQINVQVQRQNDQYIIRVERHEPKIERKISSHIQLSPCL
jgi:hypothetical protein